MTAYVDFPSSVLCPQDISMAPFYNTQQAQDATNGMRRSVGMSSAQWKLRFNVQVYNQATARAFRGFLYNIEADSQLVRIRMPDRYAIDVGHAIPTLEATFSQAAELNDREIYVSADSELPGGCAISINEFCYGIAGSWTETDGSNRLKLSPPLRQAAPLGAVISLAPIFVGTCIIESPGYEATTVRGKYGFHALEFVEDLTRLVDLT